jgi:hypothetical protein
METLRVDVARIGPDGEAELPASHPRKRTSAKKTFWPADIFSAGGINCCAFARDVSGPALPAGALVL